MDKRQTKSIQDAVAREISAEVFHHIVAKYPDVVDAVNWRSYKRSVGQVIRHTMKRLSDASECGNLDKEIRSMKSKRASSRNMIHSSDDIRAAFARDVTPKIGESETPSNK